MNQDRMEQVMENVFEECRDLRKKGQQEYAREGADAFANFIRGEMMTAVERKKVLLVYALKHWDGIVSYTNGHKSQREDVRGRINDLIVYMCLLRGMVDEESAADTQPKFNVPRPEIDRLGARIERLPTTADDF